MARFVLLVAALAAALVLPPMLGVFQCARAGTRGLTGPIVALSTAAPCCSMPHAPLNIASAVAMVSNSNPIVRIDEDWELTITEPEPEVGSPQISTVMAPQAGLDGHYVMFVLNQRYNPRVAAGGLEMQFWHGDSQLGATSRGEAVLHFNNEKITWTQRLMVKGDADYRFLCFRIVDVASDSWGTFSESDRLHMNSWTNLTDLSEYSSSVSVQNSGVTFASNRVNSLVLKQVRGYSESGEQMYQESNPVVVFQKPTE